MKSYKRMLLPALAGILLAVCLEGFMAFRAAGCGYGERDRLLSLSPAIIEGYEISGDQYRVASDVPFLIFYTEEPIGFLDVYFSAPTDGDISVNLYYSGERGAAFDRFRRVQRYLMDGTQKARIPLPPGEWRDIRLDIRGDFCLERFEAGPSVPPGELSASKVLLQVYPLRFLFLAAAGIGGCISTAGAGGKKRAGGAGRIVCLDGIRALAAFVVIAVHVTEPVKAMVPAGSLLSWALTACVSLGLTSNLLFVLLSGALILPWREEGMGEFIRKRLLRVVLPLLVYGIFYIRFLCVSETDFLSWFSYGCRAFLSGRIEAGPHLWLVYELLGLYLAAVPLRFMVKDMPEPFEKGMVCLILGFLTLRTISLYTGQAFGVSAFLEGWPGIFLMGYFLTREWMRQYDGLWMAGGCVAFIAALALSGFRADYQAIIANCSIIMMLMSGAVFTAFLHCDRALRPLKGMLAFVSRYSYSILLVHLYVLNGWIYNGWFSSGLPAPVQLIAPILSCSVLSLLTAVLVDHTAVAEAEAAVKWMIGTAGKKAGKRREN